MLVLAQGIIFPTHVGVNSWGVDVQPSCFFARLTQGRLPVAARTSSGREYEGV